MKILIVSDNESMCNRVTGVFDRYGIEYATGKVPELGYDLIVSAHSRQIFPKEIVQSARCVNIHPGMNPFNRGMFPHVFSIINGLPAGATIHEMDEYIDNGKIIVQDRVDVYPWDTSETLYNRVTDKEIELLDKYFSGIVFGLRGNINTIDDYSRLCRLDMDHVGTMREHIDLLRALSHGEHKNGYFEVDGKPIYIKLCLSQ